MKLKDWADKEGISYITAYRWFKAGKLPVQAYQAESGTIIVEEEVVEAAENVMPSVKSNDSPVAQIIKKAVEISKSGASVEDLATFVISNFKLSEHEVSEAPPARRARMKPTKEMTENHFKKFMKNPKSKPEAQMFLVNENDLENVVAASEKVSSIDDGMGVEFTGAQKFGKLVPSTVSATITSTSSKDQSIASVMDTVMHHPQNLVATPNPYTRLDNGTGSFYRSPVADGGAVFNSTLSAASAAPSVVSFNALASLPVPPEEVDEDFTLDDAPEPMNEALVYRPVTYDEARALVSLTFPSTADALATDRRAKQYCQLDRESFDNLYHMAQTNRK